MLHYKTITPELKDILFQLMKINELKDCCLVGGTNLSLQIGHRKSDDIDFFYSKGIDKNDIVNILNKNFSSVQVDIGGFGVFAYIKHANGIEVKVDIIGTDEFIRPIIKKDGLRLASIEDVIAMKLETISNRDQKKDYWDLAELSNQYSLYQMLKLYKERYPYFDVEPVISKITDFSLCEGKTDPYSYKGLQWHDVKFTLIDAFKDYINRVLIESVKKDDIQGVKAAILKGADVKTLDKSDFENLPDEKKHQMTEVLHSAIAEKMTKDDLGHLKLGDSDKGLKI